MMIVDESCYTPVTNSEQRCGSETSKLTKKSRQRDEVENSLSINDDETWMFLVRSKVFNVEMENQVFEKAIGELSNTIQNLTEYLATIENKDCNCNNKLERDGDQINSISQNWKNALIKSINVDSNAAESDIEIDLVNTVLAEQNKTELKKKKLSGKKNSNERN